MSFSKDVLRLGKDATAWAEKQADDRTAWDSCSDPRWMLWWLEYVGADPDLLDKACSDSCELHDHPVVNDAKVKQVAWVRPVAVDLMARQGGRLAVADPELLAQSADKVRAVFPYDAIAKLAAPVKG